MQQRSGEAEGPEGDLTDDDLTVYRLVLEGTRRPADCAAALGVSVRRLDGHLARLTSRGLLRAGSEPDEYHAASPHLAAAELTTALRVRAQQLMSRADTLRREFGPFSTVYEAHERRRLAGPDTEVLRDGDAVRRRLVDLSAQVETRVLAAHPSLGPPETLRAALELDSELLERGVEYRTVVPHTARRQREALRHVLELRERGAQVRSAAVIPARMILIDGTAAMVSVGEGPGAALFREPAFVDFLGQIFDHVWEHAKPFTDGDYDEQVFGEIEVAILDQLSKGRSDDYISRRLGISTRTLRRYLADIYRKLGVETRFQLGMAAARLDLAGEVRPAHAEAAADS
jgi:DNA-binding CsgD family transcriptional regulator